MRTAGILALAIAAALGACAGGDDEPRTPVALEDSVPDLAHEPAAGMDRPGGGMGTALMQDLQGGAAGGEVTVYDRGGETELRVTLTGGGMNAEHPGHVHSGTCATIGQVLQPLEPVSTDSTGTGTMTTDLSLERSELETAELVIVYHGEGGRPLVCGEVPEPTEPEPI
jgi:hypothetical protein